MSIVTGKEADRKMRRSSLHRQLALRSKIDKLVTDGLIKDFYIELIKEMAPNEIGNIMKLCVSDNDLMDWDYHRITDLADNMTCIEKKLSSDEWLERMRVAGNKAKAKAIIVPERKISLMDMPDTLFRDIASYTDHATQTSIQLLQKECYLRMHHDHPGTHLDLRNCTASSPHHIEHLDHVNSLYIHFGSMHTFSRLTRCAFMRRLETLRLYDDDTIEHPLDILRDGRDKAILSDIGILQKFSREKECVINIKDLYLGDYVVESLVKLNTIKLFFSFFSKHLNSLDFEGLPPQQHVDFPNLRALKFCANQDPGHRQGACISWLVDNASKLVKLEMEFDGGNRLDENLGSFISDTTFEQLQVLKIGDDYGSEQRLCPMQTNIIMNAPQLKRVEMVFLKSWVRSDYVALLQALLFDKELETLKLIRSCGDRSALLWSRLANVVAHGRNKGKKMVSELIVDLTPVISPYDDEETEDEDDDDDLTLTGANKSMHGYETIVGALVKNNIKVGTISFDFDFDFDLDMRTDTDTENEMQDDMETDNNEVATAQLLSFMGAKSSLYLEQDGNTRVTLTQEHISNWVAKTNV